MFFFDFHYIVNVRSSFEEEKINLSRFFVTLITYMYLIYLLILLQIKSNFFKSNQLLFK